MLKLIDNKDDCGTVRIIRSHFTGKKIYIYISMCTKRKSRKIGAEVIISSDLRIAGM